MLSWLTDYEQAKARSEGKVTNCSLLDFTGSDWCGWCIRLRREVFSQPEFQEYAKQESCFAGDRFPSRERANAGFAHAKPKSSHAIQHRRFSDDCCSEWRRETSWRRSATCQAAPPLSSRSWKNSAKVRRRRLTSTLRAAMARCRTSPSSARVNGFGNAALKPVGQEFRSAPLSSQ